jgi:hypothetical protein
VAGGEEDECVGAYEATDGDVGEDIGDGTAVVWLYSRQTQPLLIIIINNCAGLVYGKMTQERIDMVPRILGGQVSGTVQLIDKVPAVVELIVVLCLGLDEALVQVAYARGEDLEAGA